MAEVIEATGTWKMIDERQKVLQDFYNQVDKTRLRLNLHPFQIKDFKGENNLDDVINVTENKSVNYAKRVVAGLMSYKWQTVVEGQITSKDAHQIENFINDSLDQADEFIFTEHGLANLDTWLMNHVTHTSLIGVQWTSSIEDGEYKVDSLPLDMLYTPFVLNKWVAPITLRNKGDLHKELEDYAKLAEQGFGTFFPPGELKEIDNEVRDYWSLEVNELWIEKQLVFIQPNTYKTLPFVIVWVPSGFMFRDKGYLKHESPSVLFANENLFDQLSRQLTIDATLGMDPILPAYEKETGETAGGLSEPAPKRGESLDVKVGERHQLLPRTDVNNAQLASRGEVTQMVDAAAPISPRAFNQPPSAVEVAIEIELLDEIQNPLIIALRMFKEELGRLIIDQFILVSENESITSVQAGRTGRKREFNVTSLKNPDKYFISYKPLKQNKRLAIVNEARFLSMVGKAPMKFLLRDVLMVEDPDGWDREMELDKAKAANPAIGRAEMAIRYAEEAEEMDDGTAKDLKNLESQILVHDYVIMMRQRMNPVPNESENVREATEETGNAQGLISMLGSRG